MSFFQEESDDSNLQYDNAAFLYFIASTLIIAAATLLTFIVNTLLSLRIPHKDAMIATGFLQQQVNNLAKWKRSKVFTTAFFLKVILLIVLLLLIVNVYHQSRQVENKMKGFDPFEILGLAPGATLREVKKAYRKLALQYHPDRNQGNPEAQAKFILISKSYECFTDESKTANCFKYGNPDGATAFRVGIGLPKLFIQAEYKWYILPLVLTIFLIVVPFFIFNWSNRNREIDPSGISIKSYRTLFQCMQNPLNKYSVIAFLSSFAEIYDHPTNSPISKANRELLQAELTRNPAARRPVLEQFTDNQLNAFWEIYKYSAGIGEFTYPAFREVLQQFMEKSFLAVKPFTMRANDGIMLYGNPEWTVRFVGISAIEALCRFCKDYYSRTLTVDDNSSLWLNHLRLTPEELTLAKAQPLNSIYEILQSKQKLDQFLGRFDEKRREVIGREVSSLPLYRCQAKVLVDNQQVETVTSYDYIEIKFRIQRINVSGFCILKNYPYPKEEEIHLLVVSEGNMAHYQKIKFRPGSHQFIGKMPIRVANAGTVLVQFYFINTAYYNLDVFANVTLKVLEPTPEQINKKIEFHPQDINIEKSHKNFFEEIIDLQLDAEQNELSDDQEQEQAQK